MQCAQIPGQLFVLGDGDCGQLGLGEDVTERLRPFPVDVDGQKARLAFGWGINGLVQECVLVSGH